MLLCLLRRRVAYGAALALAMHLAPEGAAAQSQPAYPDAPPHFAITNARIVPVSGSPIASGTVVVRDGIIAAVGPNVEVPAGAWTIDGSGLTVYPGLVDAFSTLGHARPRGNGNGGNGRPEAEHSWGPEDRPGTFTWASAADELDATDDRIESWRKAGFTSAVSTRENGFFPGSAVLLNLLPRADRARELVVTPLGLQRINLQSRETPGYPGSLLGSFAYIKQLYEDAAYYDRVQTAYQRDSRGRGRPEYDRALEALRGSAPVLFPAGSRTEIRRAIETGEAIGRPVIVYGAQGAYDAADLLGTRTPALIDLDWPTPPRDADPEAEPDLATLRAWEHSASTPARLHEAGVPFAFYVGGLSNPADFQASVRQAIAAGLPEDAALRAMTIAPARIFGVADRLGTIERGKIANLVITEGDIFAEGSKVRRVVVDGRPIEIFESANGRGRNARANGDGDGDGEGGDPASAPAAPVAMADADGPYRSDRATIIRNATVMTVTNGTMEGADVLIRDGRIAAVGQDLSAPSGATEVDATGMYLTPGIIDAHSHIAADAINEGTVNVSAMVGMKDVIDPTDPAIYRALAGGVTTVNLLHGSANPIGGRNATLKLRWGADAPEMVFEGAPEGIKFALGENTKRDRNPSRYPNTRMGVQDVVREAFLDAQEYMREQEAYQQRRRRDRNAVAPRRDLKLETLAEILRGERLVHAHTYRGDETLQLLRLAEELGFRIATFQHILEGYKVADELAAHGAGASTFSDWWAYKVEAWDAIPYNAALMAQRGVLVSINSDDAEEMRHLNLEAAKTMRYGGLSEDEALRLITINPATQLGIQDRVGSIEPGKDADLVLFSAHPLSIDAVVQQTYVDGRRYFDIELDRQRLAAIEREKEMLMAKHQPSRDSETPAVAASEEVAR